MPSLRRPRAAARPVRAETRPVRLRDRIRIPAPSVSPAELTGLPERAPRPRAVAVPDPANGIPLSVTVWEYEPADDAPRGHAEPAPSPRREPLPHLVFVHGFRGDHHGLALVADALPEFAVHSVDLPGFGTSDAFPAAEHTVAHHGDALAATVTALDLPAPPVLVAHSYGSIVAAHLVARDPSPWRALVLLNPIAEPALDASGSLLARGAAAVAQGYYELAARLPDRPGRAALSAAPVVWATTVLMSRTQDRGVLAYTHDQHRRYFSRFASRRMLSEAYRASTTSTVLDAAPGLTLPVTLVAGAQDPLGSVTAQQGLAEAVDEAGGTAGLHMLEGVGHLLHYERPVECAELIRAAALHD